MKKIFLILAAIAVLAAGPAHAVRPFITDDATLIGHKRLELANWFYATKGSVEVWHSLSYGFTDWAELIVAGFHGALQSEVTDGWKYAFTAPLLQAKFLIRDYEPNGLPGLTFAIGSDLPWGNEPFEGEGFKAPGYGAFGFFSITQCIGEDEDILIHGQLGGTYLRDSGEDKTGLVWGIGTQFRVYKGFHGIAELVNGDPYAAASTGYLYQAGFRQFVTDDFQFDLAYGSTLGGKDEFGANSWISGGVRWVFNFNKSNKFAPNGRRL